jgi:membrane-bound ClpP family serine protease
VAGIGQTRVNTFVERQLDELANAIEGKLNADVMAIVGPIYDGADDQVRQAIEARDDKRKALAVVLDTGGGVIEVVERMVRTIRYHYPKDVTMIIPGRAMSAGTVFAMSGDRIMMDYFSCLGPIDPQVARDDKLVPALSYLVQFERLKTISAQGALTPAEAILLQKLDLAELHSFEEAKELSHSLLKEWLATYKFKNWKCTETQQKPVTREMKEERALEIAAKLSDHQRWHSHGRSISMQVLQEDLNLKIEDFGGDKDLSKQIKEYHQFLDDYMAKIGAYHFVHTKNVCLAFLAGPV